MKALKDTIRDVPFHVTGTPDIACPVMHRSESGELNTLRLYSGDEGDDGKEVPGYELSKVSGYSTVNLQDRDGLQQDNKGSAVVFGLTSTMEIRLLRFLDS